MSLTSNLINRELKKHPEKAEIFKKEELKVKTAIKFFKIRNHYNMTQEEFAKKLNVATSTIARIELAESLPSFQTIIKLSQFTGSEITINADVQKELITVNQ